MRTEKEINNTGVFLFTILFSLFILFFSDRPVSHNSRVLNNIVQSEQYLRDPSGHINATLSETVSLPLLYKANAISLEKPVLNMFSLDYRLADYNHSANHEFINIQKNRFVTGPLLLHRIRYSLPFSEKDDLPVLS